MQKKVLHCESCLFVAVGMESVNAQGHTPLPALQLQPAQQQEPGTKLAQADANNLLLSSNAYAARRL